MLVAGKNLKIQNLMYYIILDHIIPDFVHILHKGAIVESGTSDLAKVIEKKGYKDFIKK